MNIIIATAVLHNIAIDTKYPNLDQEKGNDQRKGNEVDGQEKEELARLDNNNLSSHEANVSGTKSKTIC